VIEMAADVTGLRRIISNKAASDPAIRRGLPRTYPDSATPNSNTIPVG
jgi:hypothetical protein